MNSKKARQLRFIAKQAATEAYGFHNANVQVKSMKSGRIVMNESGVGVPEEVPVVTFTRILNDDCARKIYKELKKEERRNA